MGGELCARELQFGLNCQQHCSSQRLECLGSSGGADEVGLAELERYDSGEEDVECCVDEV